MAAIEVRSETLTTGHLADRLSAHDTAEVVLLYTAEERGSLDTCGCAVRPRGSAARAIGYRTRLERRQPDVPTVLLDVGGWLDDGMYPDGTLQEHVPVRDAFMVQGLEQGGWDVLGVGWWDAPYLATTALPSAAVSANLRAPGLPTHKLVAAGSLTVAVTAVTGAAPDWKQVAGWTTLDPVVALTGLVPTLDADLVVVLAFDTDDATRRVVRQIPGVDVVIEADGFAERAEALGDADTVWVRAHTQGMRLGELRLDLADGQVRSAVDRQIDLDRAIPADRRLWRLKTAQERAVGALSD